MLDNYIKVLEVNTFCVIVIVRLCKALTKYDLRANHIVLHYHYDGVANKLKNHSLFHFY